MTPLGKPLVFYLKYMAEMNRLYGHLEGEEQDLTGLANAEQVQEMARTVGAAAFKQAADFLELCGNKIEDHFISLGTATLDNKKKRAAIVNDWHWRAHVRLRSMRDSWFACGVTLTAPPEIRVSLEKDVCGIVVPWLWVKGGRQSEDAVGQLLGGGAHALTDEELFNARGAVALACIPIKTEPPESFDVDREQLIAEVMKTIARIGAEQTTAIANLVAGLKEPGES
jgi:hypothetical protein